MYLSKEIKSIKGKFSKTRKGFHVIYAPMGSGKTYMVKKLFLEPYSKDKYKVRQPVVIAPYKTCKQDYCLTYTCVPNLTSNFLYPTQLINIYLNSSSFFKVGTPDEVILHLERWLSNLSIDWNEYVYILDEVDFFWFQCRKEFTPLIEGYMHSDRLLTTIIEFIASKTLVVGVTASRIPDSIGVKHKVILTPKTTTSVKFKKINLVGTNNVVSSIVFNSMLKNTLKRSVPTIVYKSRYSSEDIRNIALFAIANDKKVLVVIRKDNSPMKIKKGHYDEAIVKEDFKNVQSTDEDIALKAGARHFALVEGDSALLVNSRFKTDVFSTYDYVFVNQSSSRQVSIPQKGKQGSEVQVYCQGAQVTPAMLQVGGRFRHNPVLLNIWINKISQDKLQNISVGSLSRIDSSMSKYGIKQCNISYKFKGNLHATVGKRVSDNTLAKQKQLKMFILGEYPFFNLSNRQLYLMYKGEHANGYGRSVFYKHVTAYRNNDFEA